MKGLAHLLRRQTKIRAAERISVTSTAMTNAITRLGLISVSSSSSLLPPESAVPLFSYFVGS